MKRIVAVLVLSLSSALPLMAQTRHAMLKAAAGEGAPASSTPSVTLTWTASTTPGSAAVNVYRCTGTPCTSTSSFVKLTTGIAAGGPYSDGAVTAGAYSYYVTAVIGGAESAASNIATVTIPLQTPVMTFSVANQTYGAAPFTVSATSSSAGAIAYTVVSGPATVSGPTVTLTGAGTVTIQASQSASGAFAAGTSTTTFTVLPQPPTGLASTTP